MATKMKMSEIMGYLKRNSNRSDIPIIIKYGILPNKTFGTKLSVIRKLSKKIGTDHALAMRLWERDFRETRILATMIADPDMVSKKLLDNWSSEFSNSEICDQAVNNLFSKTKFAWDKAIEWSNARKEFRKRAAFMLMARLAQTEKRTKNALFEKFLPMIVKGSLDGRDMVRTSVSFALRQIGRRNITLNKKTVDMVRALKDLNYPSTKWIGSDALRYLTNKRTIESIRSKKR